MTPDEVDIDFYGPNKSGMNRPEVVVYNGIYVVYKIPKLSKTKQYL